MDLTQTLINVNQELDNNPECITGVLINKRAFAREQGKNEQPELLCLLYADLYDIYVYGHVFYCAPENAFVACLVESDRFSSGRDTNHLFERFDFNVIQRGHWQPIQIQEDWNAFAISPNFDGACRDLQRMIEAFSFEKRCSFDEDSPHHYRCEYRILGVYPFPNCQSDYLQSSTDFTTKEGESYQILDLPISVEGKSFWLWRLINDQGDEVELYLQKDRGQKSAIGVLKKSMKRRKGII